MLLPQKVTVHVINPLDGEESNKAAGTAPRGEAGNNLT